MVIHLDWNECKNKRFVKEIKVDQNLVISLIKTSDNKLSSANLLKLTETTAVSKVSLIYDSLRELLEALAIQKGYKIYNHDCYCAFLKEIIKDLSSGNSFDEFRKIRNKINYYGENLTINEAKEIIFQMKSLIVRIKKILI